jgi:hypothetical protein
MKMAEAYAKRMCYAACRTDDVSRMEQAIEQASQSDSPDTANYIINYGLRLSVRRTAIGVLQYVLNHGADVESLRGEDVLPIVDEFSKDDNEKPSMEVLEILIAHGWDVNNRGNDRPLLWFVVKYPDLVQWCLDHGATLDIPSPPRLGYSHNPPQISANGEEIRHSALRGPSTILGAAARSGTVETFELLRARGAPSDPRMLHIAAQSGRLDMVRHLVDVIGLNVNAIEHEVGDHCSTPLCYFCGPRPFQEHHRELINFLLDRGADPDLDCGRDGGVPRQSPNQIARQWNNEKFLQAVKEWRAKQQQEDGADGGVSAMAKSGV